MESEASPHYFNINHQPLRPRDLEIPPSTFKPQHSIRKLSLSVAGVGPIRKLAVVRKPTSPVLVAHGEQPGLVGQLGQQAAALHHDGLRDHDDTRHDPYDDDALASPLGRALEHQRVTDGVPAVQGDATQCQHRHGD